MSEIAMKGDAEMGIKSLFGIRGRGRASEMFVEGYKTVLVKDTSFKGLWKVSFTLKEF